MKKTLMIIGGIVVGLVIFGVALFLIVFSTSKKMKCKSKEGNITLMYNKKRLTGYTVKNMSFDLDEQNAIAKVIGVEAYLDEFAEWFKANTSGTCDR